jgi:hypothetical protein
MVFINITYVEAFSAYKAGIIKALSPKIIEMSDDVT